jgi:hypothetical protein
MPQNPVRSRSRRYLIFAGLAAAIGLLLALLVVFDVGGDSGERLADYQRNLELSPTDPTYGREALEESQGLHDVDLEELLEDYLSWARYPPDSRPLRPDHVDVLEYHWVDIPARRMAVTDADGKVRDTGIECRLQPARHQVTEGESLTIALYCQAAQDEGLQKLKIESYKLVRTVADREIPVANSKIPVNDEGKHGDERAGDRIYTFQFTPDKNDWGDMYLETTFEVEDRLSGKSHRMQTHFFSSPTAPAKFTGKFREGLRDGSLVIEVEVLVEEAGRYLLEGNLFARHEAGSDPADDVPVGYARADARLTRGLQTVELLYFGRIFHDRGEAGPYVLRGLRGRLDTGAVDPDRLDGSVEEVNAYLSGVRTDRPPHKQMPYWTGEFSTRPYDLAEFSRDEYDSPAKQERLRTLRELIAARDG